MKRLRYKDIQAFNQAVLSVHSSDTVENFAGSLISALRKVASGDVFALHLIQQGAVSLSCLYYPENPGLGDAVQALHQFLGQHPALGKRFGEAESISDYVSRSAWGRTGFYNEAFRMAGQEDDLAMDFNLDGDTFMTMAVTFSWRGCSAEERFMMSLLRPHVQAAYRRAGAVREIMQTMESGGRAGVLVVDQAGWVVQCSDGLQEVIGRFLGHKFTGRHLLPSSVRAWFMRQRERESQDDISSPPMDFTMRQHGTMLSFHFLRNALASGEYLVLVGENSHESPVGEYGFLELTPREREVLAWMTEGKTNYEIARIIGISPGTVKRHLENIYAKIGVENRHGASQAAMRAQRSGRSSIFRQLILDHAPAVLPRVGVSRPRVS